MVYNGTNYNNIRDLSGSTEDTQTTVITTTEDVDVHRDLDLSFTPVNS